MKNKNWILFIFISLFICLLFSCASLPKKDRVLSIRATSLGITEVRPMIESETDSGFTSWYCTDFFDKNKVLFEVGFCSKNGNIGGFILFDGTDEGEFAVYDRVGLEHRWSWGKYSFVITPDGTGLYYDFTNVPEGESTKPRAIYKTYRR